MKKQHYYFIGLLCSSLTVHGADRLYLNIDEASQKVQIESHPSAKLEKVIFTSKDQKKIISDFPSLKIFTAVFQEIYAESNIKQVNDAVLQNAFEKDLNLAPIVCSNFYDLLQEDIYSSIEYLKIKNQKKLNRSELFKLELI